MSFEKQTPYDLSQIKTESDFLNCIILKQEGALRAVLFINCDIVNTKEDKRIYLNFMEGDGVSTRGTPVILTDSIGYALWEDDYYFAETRSFIVDREPHIMITLRRKLSADEVASGVVAARLLDHVDPTLNTCYKLSKEEEHAMNYKVEIMNRNRTIKTYDSFVDTFCDMRSINDST